MRQSFRTFEPLKVVTRDKKRFLELRNAKGQLIDKREWSPSNKNGISRTKACEIIRSTGHCGAIGTLHEGYERTLISSKNRTIEVKRNISSRNPRGKFEVIATIHARRNTYASSSGNDIKSIEQGKKYALDSVAWAYSGSDDARYEKAKEDISSGKILVTYHIRYYRRSMDGL